MRGRRDRGEVEEEDLAAARESVLCIGNSLIDSEGFKSSHECDFDASHINQKKKKNDFA